MFFLNSYRGRRVRHSLALAVHTMHPARSSSESIASLLRAEGQLEDDLLRTHRVVLARTKPVACLELIHRLIRRLSKDAARRCRVHREWEAAVIITARIKQRRRPTPIEVIRLGRTLGGRRIALHDSLQNIERARGELHSEADHVYGDAMLVASRRISQLRRKLANMRAKAEAASLYVGGQTVPNGKSRMHPVFSGLKEDQTELVALEKKVEALEALYTRHFAPAAEIHAPAVGAGLGATPSPFGGGAALRMGALSALEQRALKGPKVDAALDAGDGVSPEGGASQRSWAARERQRQAQVRAQRLAEANRAKERQQTLDEREHILELTAALSATRRQLAALARGGEPDGSESSSHDDGATSRAAAPGALERGGHTLRKHAHPGSMVEGSNERRGSACGRHGRRCDGPPSPPVGSRDEEGHGGARRVALSASHLFHASCASDNVGHGQGGGGAQLVWAVSPDLATSGGDRWECSNGARLILRDLPCAAAGISVVARDVGLRSPAAVGVAPQRRPTSAAVQRAAVLPVSPANATPTQPQRAPLSPSPMDLAARAMEPPDLIGGEVRGAVSSALAPLLTDLGRSMERITSSLAALAVEAGSYSSQEHHAPQGSSTLPIGPSRNDAAAATTTATVTRLESRIQRSASSPYHWRCHPGKLVTPQRRGPVKCTPTRPSSAALSRPSAVQPTVARLVAANIDCKSSSPVGGSASGLDSCCTPCSRRARPASANCRTQTTAAPMVRVCSQPWS